MNVIALPTQFVEEIRRTMVDRFGNELKTQIDEDGGSPCRHCLRNADAGDELILLSYSPFETWHPYREIGPIFIHAHNCARYEDSFAIPADMKRRRTFALRAYNANEAIEDAVVCRGEEAEPQVERLFSNAFVSKIHVRNAGYGCFLFELTRSA